MSKHAKRLEAARKRQLRRKLAGLPDLIQINGTGTVDLEAADAEGLRRFTMRAYNGGRMTLAGFPHPVIVDLSSLNAQNQRIPILRDHATDRLVGHSTDIEVTARTISITGVVSSAGATAAEVVTTSDNGFPWQASIGARVGRLQFVDDGETVKVNGRQFGGPLLVARNAKLQETSFVALGADDTTSALVAADAVQTIGVDQMDQFTEWLKAKGQDPETLSEELTELLRAQWEREQGEPEPTPEPITANGQGTGGDVVADLRAEGVRQSRINLLAREYPDLAATAIEQGWSLDRAESEVNKRKLEALRNDRGNVAAVQVQDESQDAQVIEAAMCLAAGMSEDRVGKDFDEKVMNVATSRKYRGVGIHWLYGQIIKAAGQSYSGSFRSNDYIRAAFNAERVLTAAGGFSTLSLSNILENVANKAMLDAYLAVQTTYQEFCAIRTAGDFKAMAVYRLDSEGAFKRVGADGEIKNISLTDAKYSNQLDTYGAIVALTRQMQVNDDLGAFTQIPAMLGRLSALRIEEAVYVLLLANTGSFFAAGNNNLNIGGAAALAIGALENTVQGFDDQVDANGKPILVSPRTLVTGTALKVTARELFDETRVDVTTTTDTRAFASNPHVGLYRPVVSPYINNTNITDQDGGAISNQSATAYFMFADPMIRAAMGVAFLNGRTQPVIESAETNFNTLGMQWRAYHDFGVAFEDPVAAQKNDGA